MADYKLKFTAAEIDEKLSSIDNKQDKLTGTQGQIVKFDAEGNVVATDDYKNAILLDRETLKNVSGEDVTEDVKVAVDTWRANIHKVNFPTKGSWNKIVCGNGKIVVTDNYDYRVACSNDDNLFNDINWSITSTGSESRIAYGNGKFVITRSSVSTSAGAAYSTDGINWTDVTLPIVNMFTYIGDVTYGNDKFVAIAKSALNTSNFQTEGSAKAAYSLDGINWTETAMPTAANWCCVVHGNDKFVALSQNSNMAAYSLDGISWTEITLPQSVNWKSITYGNGKFVAIASNGAIIYSTNGIEWNETTAEGITSLNSVTYGNGRFVAIDFYSNIAIYSDDGIEWHKTNLIEIELEDMVGWVTIAYCNDCFIATTGALSNIVAYSRDGINWFGEVLAIETASGADITDKVSEILGTSVMVGANADLEAYTYTEGKSGFVPAPHKYDYNLFLRGDGTWANPNEAGSHYTDTFYTLSSSNWTEQSDGSYAQSVSIMSVTVDNTNIVDCRTSSDKDANIAILQGWGCVNDCKQAEGTLTFYCYGDKPTVNIPINVVVM